MYVLKAHINKTLNYFINLLAILHYHYFFIIIIIIIIIWP